MQQNTEESERFDTLSKQNCNGGVTKQELTDAVLYAIGHGIDGFRVGAVQGICVDEVHTYLCTVCLADGRRATVTVSVRVNEKV